MERVPNSREEVHYLECKRIFSSAARGPFYHDGCQCFRPSGAPGTVEGTTCASCRCCKFYHRKATITVHQGAAPAPPLPAFGAQIGYPAPTTTAHRPSSAGLLVAARTAARAVAAAFSSEQPPEEEEEEATPASPKCITCKFW